MLEGKNFSLLIDQFCFNNNMFCVNEFFHLLSVLYSYKIVILELRTKYFSMEIALRVLVKKISKRKNLISLKVEITLLYP